jgi:hypothetical protein
MTYSSLSTIARATGTACNGPSFFGLRVAGDPEGDKTAGAAPASAREPCAAMRHSSATIAADVKRFCHQINTDEVFCTHTRKRRFASGCVVGPREVGQLHIDNSLAESAGEIEPLTLKGNFGRLPHQPRPGVVLGPPVRQKNRAAPMCHPPPITRHHARLRCEPASCSSGCRESRLSQGVAPPSKTINRGELCNLRHTRPRISGAHSSQITNRGTGGRRCRVAVAACADQTSKLMPRPVPTKTDESERRP